VLRAIAFIVVPAIFIMSLASPPCLADEQAAGTKQQAAPTSPKKPEMKSRGFQRSAPAAAASAPAAVPPASSPRGDGGGAEDTIGGLPGHSMEAPGRQP